VFRAFDPDRDRLVAVKLFRLDLPPERVLQLVAEFERLIAVGLAHPAVVAPVAAGVEGVNAYLAQDYVVGESLDLALRPGPMPVADVLRVGAQLAGAFDAAAAVQIHHGVLHPRDILLSADEVRVTGLGIARAVERLEIPVQVRRPYTAPERSSGVEWDQRADVFGLAAVLHEMLWGRRVVGVGKEAAASLTEIPGGNLSQLRAVFARALAEDPAERYGAAAELTAALQDAFSVGAERGRVIRSARLQRDREVARPQSNTVREFEPFLPLEPPSAMPEAPALTKNVESIQSVETEREAVNSRADLNLRPPPPQMIDSYAPAAGAPVTPERSRSTITPLAFALVVGAAIGFAAGFGVGSRSRPTDQALVVSDAPVPSAPDKSANAAPGGEPTERAPQAEPAPRPAPPPIVGSVLVRSTPPGARVLVDGREYGRTPLRVGDLARGAHTVRIVRDGYVVDERTVTITAAQPAHSMTARLTPERAAAVRNTTDSASRTAGARPTPVTKAPLTVESRPAGASVFIDGRLAGTTPLVLPDVDVGEHALHLDRDGYRRWASTIRVVATERNRVAASLDR
jgi:serine/threonine-protein kinase